MEKERRTHPTNYIHEKLFSIPKTPYTLWYQGLGALLGEIEGMIDPRPASDAMCTIALNVIKNAANTGGLFEKTVLLWERELDKYNQNKEWLGLTRDVCDFSFVVNGIKGRKRAAWGAKVIKEALPAYDLLPHLFPDDGINSGLQAQIKGRKDFYFKIIEVNKFGEVGNDIKEMIKLCLNRGWKEELRQWQDRSEYFNQLLLNVNLSAIHPDLIESIHRYVQNTDINPEQKQQINKRVKAWNFAWRHVRPTCQKDDPFNRWPINRS